MCLWFRLSLYLNYSTFSHQGKKKCVGQHWFYKMEYWRYLYILSVHHGQYFELKIRLTIARWQTFETFMLHNCISDHKSMEVILDLQRYGHFLQSAKIILAAKFWTSWSLWMLVAEVLLQTEEQWNSLLKKAIND